MGQFLKNLTIAQQLGMLIAMLGVMTASTAQLTDLMGASATHALVSLISIVSGMLGVLLSVVTGAGSQLANVSAMPGIEKITVNEKASPTLATMAVAEDQPKIEPTPRAAQVVQATAAAAAAP